MIGEVSWSVYKKYLKAGGGFLKFAVIFFCYCLSIGNGLASTSWISYWTSDGQYTRHSQSFYLGIFFGLSVTLGIVTFARSFLLARFGVSASESLHRNLLDSILRAPSSFFDTTPLGRILSRFSKDLYSIDIELAEQMDFFLFCALQVVSSVEFNSDSSSIHQDKNVLMYCFVHRSCRYRQFFSLLLGLELPFCRLAPSTLPY